MNSFFVTMKVYVVLGGWDGGDAGIDDYVYDHIITAFSDEFSALSFLDDYKNYSKHSSFYANYDSYKIEEIDLDHMNDGRKYFSGMFKKSYDEKIKKEEREEVNRLKPFTGNFVYIVILNDNSSLSNWKDCKWLIGPSCYGTKLCKVDKEKFLKFEETYLLKKDHLLFSLEQDAREYIKNCKDDGEYTKEDPTMKPKYVIEPCKDEDREEPEDEDGPSIFDNFVKDSTNPNPQTVNKEDRNYISDSEGTPCVMVDLPGGNGYVDYRDWYNHYRHIYPEPDPMDQLGGSNLRF